MIKNRFFKTTVGVPFELAIGNSLGSYPDVKTFVETATAGKLGAFLVDTTSSQPIGVPFNAALSAANKKKQFFLAFMESVNGVDRQMCSVTPLLAGEITAILNPYKAPTAQVSSLELSSGTISNLQELSFKVIETTPLNIQLPVYDYNTSFVGGESAAWGRIIDKINLAYDGEFFTASVSAYAAPTLGAATVSGGLVTSVALGSAGNNVYSAAVPTGNGQIPLVITGGGGTGAAGYLPIVNGVAKTPVITAGGTAYATAPTVTIAAQTGTGSTAITITSKDANRHFKLIATVLPTKADYSDTGATYTSTTTVGAYGGNGTVDHVRQLQFEANVRRGVTTEYAMQNATSEEFGEPVDMVGTTTQWDIVALSGYKKEDSPTPVELHTRKAYIFVAVPAGEGSKVVALFA